WLPDWDSGCAVRCTSAIHVPSDHRGMAKGYTLESPPNRVSTLAWIPLFVVFQSEVSWPFSLFRRGVRSSCLILRSPERPRRSKWPVGRRLPKTRPSRPLLERGRG